VPVAQPGPTNEDTMTNLSNSANQQGASPMPFARYTPFVPVDVPDRTWPTKKVEKAPRWL
jgi:2-isopropylmalate synthase